MKLQGFKEIEGIIECVTGLRIGGSNNTIEIGGLDNPVIRNPLDDTPYIPGSSIKGKIRTLLEWELGKVSNDGSVHKCQDNSCPICRIFGTTDESLTRLPSRALFRDAFLDKDSRRKLEEDLRQKKGLLYAEVKYENTINRLKGKAEHPRQMERIPPGIRFAFSISYRIFDELDENYLSHLLHGLWLLEQDALGGCGSRGYGKVKFHDVKSGSQAV